MGGKSFLDVSKVGVLFASIAERVLLGLNGFPFLLFIQLSILPILPSLI